MASLASRAKHRVRIKSMKKSMEDTSVLVAVRVRPMNDREKAEKRVPGSCIEVRPDGSSLRTSGESDHRDFTFDSVFHEHTAQRTVYDLTAKVILGKVLEGYNGTVFAYGQTGSGKTWTMEGGHDGEPGSLGVIPRICMDLFEKVETTRGTKDWNIRASYVEIYNEQIRDLLVEPGAAGAGAGGGAGGGGGGGDFSSASSSSSGGGNLKPTIKEDRGGQGVYLDNVVRTSVTSYEDVHRLFAQGAAVRATGSTKMNATSSRSHAIFSLTIRQQRCDDDQDLTKMTSKFHLIDLAGSERADSTGAKGERLKEGAQINKSLSALGQVISALSSRSCNKKRSFQLAAAAAGMLAAGGGGDGGGSSGGGGGSGGSGSSSSSSSSNNKGSGAIAVAAKMAMRSNFVPYRDSKLTRLLQDSLGGNSFTLMICNVSPAAINEVETLSSLRFAARAKEVKNKATLNFDPKSVELARLNHELKVSRDECAALRKRLAAGNLSEDGHSISGIGVDIGMGGVGGGGSTTGGGGREGRRRSTTLGGGLAAGGGHRGAAAGGRGGGGGRGGIGSSGGGARHVSMSDRIALLGAQLREANAERDRYKALSDQALATAKATDDELRLARAEAHDALLEKSRDDFLLQAAAALGHDLDLDELFDTAVEEAVELLGATRASLFLVDSSKEKKNEEKKDEGQGGQGGEEGEGNGEAKEGDEAAEGELYSHVTNEHKEIRVPKNARSLVGAAAVTGKVVNVADAYEDDRFDQTFDAASGFRTRAVLCMPITTTMGAASTANGAGGSDGDDGEAPVIVTGVLQLMNKKRNTGGLLAAAAADDDNDDDDNDDDDGGGGGDGDGVGVGDTNKDNDEHDAGVFTEADVAMLARLCEQISGAIDRQQARVDVASLEKAHREETRAVVTEIKAKSEAALAELRGELESERLGLERARAECKTERLERAAAEGRAKELLRLSDVLRGKAEAGEAAQAEVLELGAAKSRLTSRAAALQSDAEDLREDRDSLRDQLRKAQAALDAAHTETGELQTSKARLQARLASVTEEHEASLATVARLEDRHAQQLKTLEEASKDSEDLLKSEGQGMIAEARTEAAQQLAATQAKAEQDLAAMATQLAATKGELAGMKEEREASEKSRVTLQQKLGAAEAEARGAQQAQQALQQASREEAQELRAQLAARSGELASAQAVRDGCKAELKALGEEAAARTDAAARAAAAAEAQRAETARLRLDVESAQRVGQGHAHTVKELRVELAEAKRSATLGAAGKKDAEARLGEARRRMVEESRRSADLKAALDAQTGEMRLLEKELARTAQQLKEAEAEASTMAAKAREMRRIDEATESSWREAVASELVAAVGGGGATTAHSGSSNGGEGGEGDEDDGDKEDCKRNEGEDTLAPLAAASGGAGSRRPKTPSAGGGGGGGGGAFASPTMQRRNTSLMTQRKVAEAVSASQQALSEIDGLQRRLEDARRQQETAQRRLKAAQQDVEDQRTRAEKAEALLRRLTADGPAAVAAEVAAAATSAAATASGNANTEAVSPLLPHSTADATRAAVKIAVQAAEAQAAAKLEEQHRAAASAAARAKVKADATVAETLEQLKQMAGRAALFEHRLTQSRREAAKAAEDAAKSKAAATAETARLVKQVQHEAEEQARQATAKAEAAATAAEVSEAALAVSRVELEESRGEADKTSLLLHTRSRELALVRGALQEARLEVVEMAENVAALQQRCEDEALQARSTKLEARRNSIDQAKQAEMLHSAQQRHQQERETRYAQLQDEHRRLVQKLEEVQTEAAAANAAAAVANAAAAAAAGAATASNRPAGEAKRDEKKEEQDKDEADDADRGEKQDEKEEGEQKLGAAAAATAGSEAEVGKQTKVAIVAIEKEQASAATASNAATVAAAENKAAAATAAASAAHRELAALTALVGSIQNVLLAEDPPVVHARGGEGKSDAQGPGAPGSSLQLEDAAAAVATSAAATTTATAVAATTPTAAVFNPISNTAGLETMPLWHREVLDAVSALRAEAAEGAVLRTRTVPNLETALAETTGRADMLAARQERLMALAKEFKKHHDDDIALLHQRNDFLSRMLRRTEGLWQETANRHAESTAKARRSSMEFAEKKRRHSNELKHTSKELEELRAKHGEAVNKLSAAEPQVRRMEDKVEAADRAATHIVESNLELYAENTRLRARIEQLAQAGAAGTCEGRKRKGRAS